MSELQFLKMQYPITGETTFEGNGIRLSLYRMFPTSKDWFFKINEIDYRGSFTVCRNLMLKHIYLTGH